MANTTNNNLGVNPEQDSEGLENSGRRNLLLGALAIAVTTSVAGKATDALAQEVKLTQGETQIASLIQNIAFDPESMKLTFAGTFPILKGREAHYAEIFQSLDDTERAFALSVFAAGYESNLVPNDQARLLIAALNLVEVIGNLRYTIETGDVQEGDAVDINGLTERLTSNYPGTQNIITPELRVQFQKTYDMAYSAVIKRGTEEQGRLTEEQGRLTEEQNRSKELDRQLQLLRSLLAPSQRA